MCGSKSCHKKNHAQTERFHEINWNSETEKRRSDLKLMITQNALEM